MKQAKFILASHALTLRGLVEMRAARVGQRVRGEAPAVAQQQARARQLHAAHGAARAQLRHAHAPRRRARDLVHVHHVRVLRGSYVN